jgi:hypothetical protein
LPRQLVDVRQQRTELEMLVKVQREQLGQQRQSLRFFDYRARRPDDRAHELAKHRRAQRRFGLLALVDRVAEVVLFVDARRDVGAGQRDDRRDDRQRELRQVFDPENDELFPVSVLLHARSGARAFGFCHDLLP